MGHIGCYVVLCLLTKLNYGLTELIGETGEDIAGMPSVNTNPIYEQKIHWFRGPNRWTNTFYWECQSEPPANTGSSAVNQAFIDDLATDWLLSVVDDAILWELETRRLNNLFDFHTRAVDSAGTRLGTRAPDFVAVTVSKNRTTKETGPGWFKVGGLVETDYDGDFLVGTFEPLFQLVVDEIQTGITSGTLVFLPVIVGNKRDDMGQLPEADWVYSPWGSSTIQTQIGTQRTRISGAGE